MTRPRELTTGVSALAVGEGRPAATSPTRPRPDLLAYPAPTTSRFVVLVLALVTTGLVTGGFVHNVIRGRTFAYGIAQCAGQLSRAETRPLLDCAAGNLRVLAWFALAGGAVTALAGATVLFAAPAVIRWRKDIRPVPPALADAERRFHDIAAEMGVQRSPRLMMGSTRQRDAFSFGRPGRYCVVLPRRALVCWRDTAVFEPLVRHELAHVRHRDVAWSWLARSMWLGAVPVLVAPLIAGVFLAGERPMLLGDAWRLVVLVLAVVLSSRAVLRSREHDADLRAARSSVSSSALLGLLRLAPARPSGRVRRLLTHHPTPAERAAVLEMPAKAATVSATDGLAVAVLAGLAIPVLIATLDVLLGDGVGVDTARGITAALIGAPMGGSLGVGLWRSAHLVRLTHERLRVTNPALGAAAGFGLGELSALGLASSGTWNGYRTPWPEVLGVLAIGGVTVLSAGLGTLWADVAPRLRRAWQSWFVAVTVNALLFGVVIYALQGLQTDSDRGAATPLRRFLVAGVATPPVAIVIALLAVFAVATRVLAPREGCAPQWLTENAARVAWPGTTNRGRTALVGASAGIVSTLAIIGYRVVHGPARGAAHDQHYYAIVWLCAATAVVAALVVSGASRADRSASAVLAATTALCCSVAGFLAYNAAYGGSLDLSTIGFVFRGPGVLTFLLLLPAVLTVELLPARRAVSSSSLLPVLVTIALVGVASAAIFAGRETLWPLAGDHTATVYAETAVNEVEEAAYVAGVAAKITQQQHQIRERVHVILTDPLSTPASRAAAIRARLLPEVRALLTFTTSYSPRSPALKKLHATVAVALLAEIAQYSALADAWQHSNVSRYNDAVADAALSAQMWRRWASGVRAQAAAVDHR